MIIYQRAFPKPVILQPRVTPWVMDAPTVLRPVRAKAHACCNALTGRKEKHMAIPQGVALGYKIKGFQPTRYYHVNEYAERKP